MFERSLSTLGTSSKRILRQFTGKTRMTTEQYESALRDYNNKVIEIRKEKKELKKNITKFTASLPSFIEPDFKNYKTKARDEQMKLKLLRTLDNSLYHEQIVANNKKNALRDQLQNMKKRNKTSIQINIEKFGSIKTAVSTTLDLAEKTYPGRKYLLSVNKKYYTVNNNTRQKLYDRVVSNVRVTDEEQSSDGILVYEMLQAPKNIIFEILPEEEPDDATTKKRKTKYNRNNGAFFKYTSNIELDLSRYQISNTISNNSNDDMFESCLVYALKMGGMSESKLTELRLMSNCKNIPRCKLDEICDKLQIKLIIKSDWEKSSKFIFGKEYKETYEIGLLDEHYFLIEKIPITFYALKNYHELQNIDNFHTITERNGKYYKRNENLFIDSLKAIKFMLDNKERYLTPINRFDILHTQLHQQFDDKITDLTYEPKKDVNYKKVEVFHKKKDDKPSINIFFDFETYTDSNKIHTPYLCCIIDDNNNQKSFIGSDCALKMLWWISDTYGTNSNICLIAHNASYDIRFLYKYLYNIEEITRGNKVLSCNALFNKIKLQIKDSLLLIAMPLKEFPETFKIKNTQKEVISYKMYNETNCIEQRMIKIETALLFIRREHKDEKQFLFNIKRWNLQVDDKFDCIEYSRKYCEMDCMILQQGYNTFKQWMNSHVSINIDDVLTIASLAHRYFIQEGCYDDVFQLSGIPQAFMQKCVVGGRVMCANNQKISTTINMSDFDAVSLYPSAMKRMPGFLKGLPKIINFGFDELQTKDGYFVEIKITSVGKHRSFPLTSYTNEKGIRNFTNDMVGRTMFVDKITLEDMIHFQEVEFDIIRGYYFDEGYNNTINQVIEQIFNKRLMLKSVDNPAEIVYKLIMNSGYGKSIMKEVEHEVKYFNNEEKMKSFINTNFNWIQTFEQLHESQSWKVKMIKSINSHFNIPHVGVSILAWSKRIMNEVMCLAEDNAINIYYQDTDSMHIETNDIQKLATLFYNKYNRNLIGKHMGQFHTDFKLEGCKKCKNIYAKRSIFLGKKCYIDELVGIKDDDGTECIGYHIRMKGVSSSCIDYTWKNFKTSNPKYDRELTNPFQLYEILLNGDEIMFDLTENGQHDNFKTHSNGHITTLSEFKRKIQFL